MSLFKSYNSSKIYDEMESQDYRKGYSVISKILSIILFFSIGFAAR